MNDELSFTSFPLRLHKVLHIVGVGCWSNRPIA